MSPGFLHIYVFFTGGAVLALELSASRLLAPYFGTSLFVWGNILGIVLGALAFGYYYGGKLADRSPHRETLGLVTWIAGVTTVAIPLLSPLMLRNITEVFSGIPFFIIAASFTAVLALFALPLALLGGLTPLATRIGVRDLSEVGSVAGSLSAASTAGSLVGAFLPAFVTIPFLGTRATIIGSGAILLFLGALAVGRKRFFLGLLLPAVLLFGGGPEARAGGFMHVIHAEESPYQHIRVLESGGRHALITNEGSGVQSWSMGPDGLTEGYADAVTAATFIHPGEAPDMLHIGVAGGTLIRQIDRFSGERGVGHVDAVEIDPAMFRIAETWFGLEPHLAERHAADGRAFLRMTDRTYDIVIADAYRDELYLPFHLATREFFEEARAHLGPDGLVLLNVLGENTDDGLAAHIGETARVVFPHVAIAPLGHGYNNLIIASKRPLQWERLKHVPETLAPVAEALSALAFPVMRSERVLTDDRAPVEYLTDRFLWKAAAEQAISNR